MPQFTVVRLHLPIKGIYHGATIVLFKLRHRLNRVSALVLLTFKYTDTQFDRTVLSISLIPMKPLNFLLSIP